MRRSLGRARPRVPPAPTAEWLGAQDVAFVGGRDGTCVRPYVRRPPEPSASAGGPSDRETANRRPTTDRVCAPAGRRGRDVTDLLPRARSALAASWVARRGRRCGAFIGGEDMCPDFALCVQRLPAPTARAGGRRFRDASHRQPHGDEMPRVAGGAWFRPGDAVATEGGGDVPGLAAVAGVGKGDGAVTL